MPASFDEYMAKFTSKTRKNRLRELRHLERRGALQLVRFSSPAEVEPFLAEAGAISRRSYQQKLLGVGLRAPERLRARMHLAAQRGWLRSYVLRCGDVACSYMLGYQYKSRFHYTKVGYDPEWADLCVGSALQLLVLQDLFAERTPAFFDFGAHGPQKQYFGNHSYLERQIWLFNRGPYPTLARGLHAVAHRSNAVGSRWLTRWGMKPRVNRWLRRAAGC